MDEEIVNEVNLAHNTSMFEVNKETQCKFTTYRNVMKTFVRNHGHGSDDGQVYLSCL